MQPRIVLAFLAILIIASVDIIAALNQKGLLYCLKDGEIREATFILFKHDDPVVRVTAFNITHSVCSTDQDMLISGDGTHDNPYIMVIRWHTNGTILSPSDCGMASQTEIKVYTWYVESRIRSADSPILLRGDYNYLLTCDFSDVSELTAANGSALITEVEAGGVDRSLNNTVEDVDFFVAAESGEAVTSVELGANISLNVILNVRSEGARGVYATSCRACSQSSCSSVDARVYQISKPSGCLEKAQHVGAEDDPFFRAPSATVKVSVLFPSFRFSQRGVNVVYFFCRIAYCFGNDTDRCTSADACTLSRKRRAAPEIEEKKREVKTQVIIGKRAQASKQTATEKDVVVCSSVTMYMAISIALGVLLLLSLVVTAAIFVRVIRLRHKQTGTA